MMAATGSSSSSSAVRRRLSPPMLAEPRQRATPAEGLRPRAEPQIPIYQGGPAAGDLEPEHVPELEPAYRPPPEELAARAQVDHALAAAKQSAARQFDQEVQATWAVMPVAIWGGLSVAGCVYHGAYVGAGALLLATAGGALLPFLQQRRWLGWGVALSVPVAALGWWLLATAGGILIANTGRVLAGAALGVNDWLATSGVGLAALLSLISLIHAGRYFVPRLPKAVRWSRQRWLQHRARK